MTRRGCSKGGKAVLSTRSPGQHDVWQLIGRLLITAVLIVGAGCARSRDATDERVDRGAFERSLIDELLLEPGVTILPNGQISIRGSRVEPLVVVDGVRVAGTAILFQLNPKDVENLEVLKGPDALLYGSRGRGGVVLITTRRQ